MGAGFMVYCECGSESEELLELFDNGEEPGGDEGHQCPAWELAAWFCPRHRTWNTVQDCPMCEDESLMLDEAYKDAFNEDKDTKRIC